MNIAGYADFTDFFLYYKSDATPSPNGIHSAFLVRCPHGSFADKRQ